MNQRKRLALLAEVMLDDALYCAGAAIHSLAYEQGLVSHDETPSAWEVDRRCVIWALGKNSAVVKKLLTEDAERQRLEEQRYANLRNEDE